MKKRFVIFGHKQHGKDTACGIIEEVFGLTFMSSSQLSCDLFLFDQMKESHGYETKEACFADRVNHREHWYRAICDFNLPNKDRLAQILFDRYDIYCGIRDREEFEAMRKSELFDLAIWIDASKRKPLESSDSMKLTENDADLVVLNNGSLEEFRNSLITLFKMFGFEPKK